MALAWSHTKSKSIERRAIFLLLPQLYCCTEKFVLRSEPFEEGIRGASPTGLYHIHNQRRTHISQKQRTRTTVQILAGSHMNIQDFLQFSLSVLQLYQVILRSYRKKILLLQYCAQHIQMMCNGDFLGQTSAKASTVLNCETNKALVYRFESCLHRQEPYGKHQSPLKCYTVPPYPQADFFIMRNKISQLLRPFLCTSL